MPKCIVCGKESTLKSMVKVEERKYACVDCEQEYRVDLKSTRTLLMDYVGEIWEDVNYPLIATQVKQCQDNFDFKIEGIYLTLKWCVEIEEIKDELKYGFKYLVERYYDNARQYYLDSIERTKIALKMLEDDEVIVYKGNDNKRKLSQFRANVKGILN